MGNLKTFKKKKWNLDYANNITFLGRGLEGNLTEYFVKSSECYDRMLEKAFGLNEKLSEGKV